MAGRAGQRTEIGALGTRRGVEISPTGHVSVGSLSGRRSIQAMEASGVNPARNSHSTFEEGKITTTISPTPAPRLNAIVVRTQATRTGGTDRIAQAG